MNVINRVRVLGWWFWAAGIVYSIGATNDWGFFRTDAQPLLYDQVASGVITFIGIAIVVAATLTQAVVETIEEEK